jgi:ClpP class serine protease
MDGILAALRSELTPADYETFHRLSTDEREEYRAQAGDAPSGTKYTRISGNVGTLFIEGPIVPRADFFTEISGLVSVESLASEFAALEDNPRVESIVLSMDSPGGDITGISDFAQQIAAASKPTTAFVAGMAASAGYWIASAADRVISTDTGIVGSIGVVSTIRVRKDENAIEIVSSQSPFKRLDAETQEGRDKIQTLVDELADVFVDTVAGNRGVSRETVLEDFGRGDVMVAARARGAGMIDGMGTMAAVLDTIRTGSQLPGITTEQKTLDTSPPIDNKPNKEAPAGKSKETKKMTLSEFLAENPAAKVEFDAKISEARAEGKTQADTANKERVDAAMPFLTGDTYPDSIHNMAASVIQGSATVDTLRGAAAYHDAQGEKAKAEKVEAEGKDHKPTPPNNETLSTDGNIRTAADYEASVAAARTARGMEAK